MKLSVIVPTYHRNQELSYCLDRLSPEYQDVPSSLFEVIVTDDGVRESAEEMVKEHYSWAKWVKGPQKGPASNRNAGAEHAVGQWLLFTDDDCLPQKNWIRTYYEAIRENPTIRVLEGKSTADRKRRALSECAPINEQGGFMPSCNLAVEQRLFNELRGFDEDYPFSFEDMDFHYRVKEAGHQVVFLEDALVLHPWRNTTGKASIEFYKNQQQGIITFIKKHPEIIKSFNSKHFLVMFLKKLIEELGPGLIAYKGRGVGHALRGLHFNIKMAVLLVPETFRWYRKNLAYSNKQSSPILKETKT